MLHFIYTSSFTSTGYVILANCDVIEFRLIKRVREQNLLLNYAGMAGNKDGQVHSNETFIQSNIVIYDHDIKGCRFLF